MQRQSLAIFAAATVLTLGATCAAAQSGDLAGVTMRVLDDVGDIDAVILELDANRGDDEGAEGAEEADSAERNGDAAETEEARVAERRAREELHEPDIDERSEGKLEDNDVERAAPPVP